MCAMIEKLRIRLGSAVMTGRRFQAAASLPLLLVVRRSEKQLARKLARMTLEHEVDPFADVHGDWNLRAIVKQLQAFVLLGRDVNGRGNLLASNDPPCLEAGCSLTSPARVGLAVNVHATIHIVNLGIRLAGEPLDLYARAARDAAGEACADAQLA